MRGHPTVSLCELREEEVHVWTLDQDRIDDPDLIASYQQLLTPDESLRQEAFRLPQGRHQYLLTRALARTVLSLYADVEPSAWRFETGHWGKPQVSVPAGFEWLRFNLAHTDGLIVCAVARSRAVGVDVENLQRSGRTGEIAERYFSDSETKALRALPEVEQRERFFRYWTLKESYIKARGMGLQLPLAQFSFHLDTDPIRIAFDSRLDDDAGAWQFDQRRLSERHMLALAVRRGGGPDLEVCLRPFVPLRPLSP